MGTLSPMFWLVPIVTLLGVITIGACWRSFRRKRQMKRLAMELWRKCEDRFLSVAPAIYRQRTKLKVCVEPYYEGRFLRLKRYRLLIIASLLRSDDLPRVKLLLDRCIVEFLEQPGHERLQARSYYTSTSQD